LIFATHGKGKKPSRPCGHGWGARHTRKLPLAKGKKKAKQKGKRKRLPKTKRWRLPDCALKSVSDAKEEKKNSLHHANFLRDLTRTVEKKTRGTRQ